MRAQIQVASHGLWRKLLLHTLPDPIKVDTAVGERLLNGRFNQRRRMLLMQWQDAHKFAHPASLWPLLAQALQQLLVARRPAAAPVLDRFGVVKGRRALPDQREDVQR